MDEGWRRTGRASKRNIGFVYKLTCTVNGKGYIGLSTASFKRRMQGHKSKAHSKLRVTGCRALNNAIRKHGWDAFTKEILANGIPRAELGEG